MMIQPQALIKGRYRVGRRLGEGGMAVVYLGHDLLLGRDVAIKSPRPQLSADPAFLARFEREVDPDGRLDPEERARRAEQARRAYFARLSLAAAKARRAKRGRRQGGDAA